MEYSADLIGESLPLDGLEELLGLHEVAESQIAQIPGVLAQPVDDQNPAFALGVESVDQIASNKPGSAGHNQHQTLGIPKPDLAPTCGPCGFSNHPCGMRIRRSAAPRWS